MKHIKIFLAALALSGAVLNSPAQPVITTQPSNQTNLLGTTATLCVGATGTAPLTYQWRAYLTAAIGWTNIPGETNACLDLPNAQPWITSNAFRVLVSNPEGSVQSSLVRVRVITSPVISQQPTNLTVEVGTDCANAVTMEPMGPPGYLWTGPACYQWCFNEMVLPDRTNSNLTILNAQVTDSGCYSVVITNQAGSVTSRVACLTVVNAAFTLVTNGLPEDVGIPQNAQWVDYNNDGFPDLFVVGGYVAPSTNRLYRNNGDRTFTSMTASEVGSIVSDFGDWTLADWADYDNDGDLDVILTAWTNASNVLYRNDGGTFTRVNATEPRLTGPGYTAGAPWADIDNDGRVDLFMTTISLGGGACLYRNTGAGFVTVPGPLCPGPGSIEGATWCDYDNDGDLDLILADPVNEGGLGLLVYQNDGAGNFSRVMVPALTSASGYVIDAVVGDYDNDGFQDVCVARLVSTTTSSLFHNDGNGQFTERSDVILPNILWADWGDYDNDGYLDLFICRGLGNRLYHNKGDGTFLEMKNTDLVTKGDTRTRQCAWGDYDNDGFLDLVRTYSRLNPLTNLFLFHNEGNTNHWLKVKLQGSVCNRAAIGAKVRVKATIGGKTFWQLREMTRGMRSSGDDLRAHFGLGDATSVETLRIEWPSGQVTETNNVASNQILNITEPPRLQAIGKFGDRFEFQLTAHQGMTWDLSTSTHVHDHSQTCPNPDECWRSTLSVTNTSGTITVCDSNCAGSSIRFYLAAPK